MQNFTLFKKRFSIWENVGAKQFTAHKIPRLEETMSYFNFIYVTHGEFSTASISILQDEFDTE